MLHQIDLRPFHGQVGVFAGHGEVDHVGERARRALFRSAPPPMITKFSAPFSTSAGIAVRVLEHRQDPRAQSLCFLERVERKAVLLGSLRVEEVRLRPGRQDQEVALVTPAVSCGHRPALRIGNHHLGHLHVHVRVATKRLAKRRRDIARPDLRGGDLVEQRLELVVVVLVDQRDLHVVALGQLARAPEPGKAAADDHDVRSWFRGLHGFTLRPQPESCTRLAAARLCQSSRALKPACNLSTCLLESCGDPPQDFCQPLVSSPHVEGEESREREIVKAGLSKCGEVSQPIVTAAIRPDRHRRHRVRSVPGWLARRATQRRRARRPVPGHRGLMAQPRANRGLWRTHSSSSGRSLERKAPLRYIYQNVYSLLQTSGLALANQYRRDRHESTKPERPKSPCLTS